MHGQPPLCVSWPARDPLLSTALFDRVMESARRRVGLSTRSAGTAWSSPDGPKEPTLSSSCARLRTWTVSSAMTGIDGASQQAEADGSGASRGDEVTAVASLPRLSLQCQPRIPVTPRYAGLRPSCPPNPQPELPPSHPQRPPNRQFLCPGRCSQPPALPCRPTPSQLASSPSGRHPARPHAYCFWLSGDLQFTVAYFVSSRLPRASACEPRLPAASSLAPA